MFKSFSLNLSIKKDIMIIDEIGIKNTDDLQGNMSARLLISTKYWIIDKKIEQKPKIPKEINSFVLSLIKIKEIKNVIIEMISLYENQ
mgnify:FL=1